MYNTYTLEEVISQKKEELKQKELKNNNNNNDTENIEMTTKITTPTLGNTGTSHTYTAPLKQGEPN